MTSTRRQARSGVAKLAGYNLPVELTDPRHVSWYEAAKEERLHFTDYELKLADVPEAAAYNAWRARLGEWAMGTGITREYGASTLPDWWRLEQMGLPTFPCREHGLGCEKRGRNCR